MLTRESLYARGCVRGLVQLLGQVPSRAAFRLPMALDPNAVGLLLFWTILRWERTFVLKCLEALGVDMWALTCQTDELLERHRVRDGESPPECVVVSAESRGFAGDLESGLSGWVAAAEQQAAIAGHGYVGIEHLLLAILRQPVPELAAILTSHGLTHDKVKDAVLAVLPATMEKAAEPPPNRPTGPKGASWDTPAIGVPRRFGMAVLMLLMTMYAILFAIMQLFDAWPEVFVVIAVLFTGVGIGQMLLFGGRYPRAASIWVGTVLFPVEIVGLMFYAPQALVELLVLLVFSPALGAGFGYLGGGLTAGIFLLLERYAARAARVQPAPQEQERGPFDP